MEETGGFAHSFGLESRWWVRKKQMAFVFITIAILLQLQMKATVGCLENERMGLLELKSYLGSLFSPEEGSLLKSWSHVDPKSDCCHWERVKCSDAIDGHVINLILDGILPYTLEMIETPWPLNLSLLHSFPQLKTLDFSWNGFGHLFDPIYGYKSFQRLENLRILDFTENFLNNSVLPFLSAARSLRTLNLRHNNLQGVFHLNGLINLTELEVLDIGSNGLENGLEAGDELRTMKLKTLDLSMNLFSDTARLKGLEHLLELRVLRLATTNIQSIQELKDMPKLQELDLSMNGFNDLDSLGLLFPSSLQVLLLRSNELSATEEGYSKICRLVYLRELDLSKNELTTLPSCLGNLSRLRALSLSSNQLNGNLSSFLSGLPSSIEYLSLLRNNFNGSFSFNALVKQRRLRVFELSSTLGKIEAQAESSWVPHFQLKNLVLPNVILGSTMPGFLVYQHEMCYIDISYGQLTGGFPTWLVQNNTRLRVFLVKNNSLRTFQLPKVVHGLRSLDISGNHIDGSIQEDIGIVFPNLSYLNIASNHFYGTIPSSMGEMKSLETLDMSSNDLSGELPLTFFSRCYSLKFLRLSNNQFQGQIFREHANFIGLNALFLGGNNFSGSLGKGSLNSKHLKSLDISNNHFSGRVPLWIGRLSKLRYLYMRGNQLKGSFPCQLIHEGNSKLEVLDISYNSFSGSIPRNFDFQSLMVLKLQGNEFTGTIPESLFEASNLEILDLGNNNFSGMILNSIGKTSNLGVLLLRNNSIRSHIPEELCQLSKVSILDLSHNKFSGAIPPCFANMSISGGSYDDRYLAFTEEEEGTIVEPWSYKSSLTAHDLLTVVEHKSNPPNTADFNTKSRYEAYQGTVLQFMSGLDLSSNELSGEIPVEIGDLKDIKSLNFSRNRLTGSIPDSIIKLKDLESLDLSQNKLSGKIPPQLAGINTLGYFNVSSNNFSGEIPFKGHFLTFDERSYKDNAHLCGPPTNKICNPTSVQEPGASTHAEEDEDEGDGWIDMVWFYWSCAGVYISGFLAFLAFLFIDSPWSRAWFYRVDLFVNRLQRFKRCFV